ncbi:MAG: alginate export family protein [Bacteroidales bacterium]|nr:alginate export family protein [Bacteroidales bacterium]
MKNVILICGFVLLIISQTSAQFTLKGEFRPRFEYRDGYGKILAEDEKPITIISQRSRLSAYYQTGIYSFGFAIQDVMIWGDEDLYSSTGVFGSKSSIDLNEAWIGIKPYERGFIKIGRQYWAYEDERLLSLRNWNQSEIKYDAVLFRHSQDKLQVDAGLSWNNDIDRNFSNEYPTGKMKSLNYVYVKKQVNEWLYASAMAMASGFTATDTTSDINWNGTYGAYLGVKKDGLSVLASGFFQNGKSRKGPVSQAYMFAMNGDYLIKNTFSVGAGIDYLSGQNQENTDPDYADQTHAFDIFYGIRHRVFGHMDLFNNLPKSTGDGGLVDVFVRLKWLPVKNTTLGADFHFFSLQNNVIDRTTEDITYLSKGLGQELDLNASWDISKIFNIKGGYSFFLVTDSMEKLQGIEPGTSRFPTWAWIGGRCWPCW